MAEGFDAGRFELLFDAGQNKWLLYENNTEQKAILADGDWDLAVDEEGQAFVCNAAGQSEWADDLMDHIVVRNPASPEQLVVMLKDGLHMSLTEYQQRHRSIQVPIKATGHGTPPSIAASLLRQPVGGALVLWCLPSLFNTLVKMVMATTCSGWYQNWWQWWTKHLMALGIEPSLHIRKPAQINCDDGERHPTRFLPTATMSTYALVTLMTRWSGESKSGAKKNQSVQAHWHAALRGILDTFFGEQEALEFGIFLDAAVQMRPGVPMQGSGFVRLRVTKGLVDVTPLLSCDEQAVLETMATLGRLTRPTELPLMHFCLLLDKAGRKAQWLWKQLIFVISGEIDRCVARSLSVNEDRAGPVPELMSRKPLPQTS